MGNLDLINLSLNMSIFPTITISSFPEEKPTTIMPAIYALSKDPKAFVHPPLLAKIADRFKQINQQQNEDFIKEMTTSLPLSNANLQPDPSKIPSDFTRHVLDLIRKNEKMIAKGLAPIDLIETKIKLLRPSKRKYFMVQLMKQAAKENKLKNQDCLELGVHKSEVEKILKSSTKPEIIKRLNHEQKKIDRSKRNVKRVNMLNLTQSMQPSIINLESICNMEHIHDDHCNEPRKSCYQVNHMNNLGSGNDIWIPKELIADDDIHTDSSSCASVKSPCKFNRDNDNLSHNSEASPDNKGCKDFKLVMAKKMMQKAKMAMKQELESDSESEDAYDEISLFAPKRDSGEKRMLSFPSAKTNATVSSVYNRERLSSMKKGSERKLKRGFSHVIGSSTTMSKTIGPGSMKLASKTSLHDILEERTPKENDDKLSIDDLDGKIDRIVSNKGNLFGYAGNIIKNISNLNIGSNFVSNNKIESISNESSLSRTPIRKAQSITKTTKSTKNKSFRIRSQSKDNHISHISVDKNIYKQDSLVTGSVKATKKNTTFNWNMAPPQLAQYNVEKKELSTFIADTKNYYNFNMTQKDCFKLKLSEKPPLPKETNKNQLSYG